MVPKHLLLFYTHLSQTQSYVVQGLAVTLDTDTFADTDSGVVEVGLTLSQQGQDESTQEVEAVELDYRDFKDPIRASSPVPAWSKANIYDLVSYERYNIVAAVPEPCEERVEITYKQAEEFFNPVVKSKTLVVLDQPEQQTISNEVYADLLHKKLLRTPNQVGLLHHLVNVDRDEADTIDWDNVIQESRTSTLFLPSSKGGWLGALKVSDSMEELTCESVAWGLINAVAYDDADLIVSNLKEFRRQAVLRGWLTLNPDGIYILNDRARAGFETSFSLIDTYSTQGIKEVAGNAFLGYALCVALTYLFDRHNFKEYDLRGEWFNFKNEVLAAVEALALFCSASISPVTHWSSYKEQNGFYSYDTPSLTSSYFCDIFFSHFLTLRYNKTVHYSAARLRRELTKADLDLSSPFYTPFAERNFLDPVYFLEPAWLRDIGEVTAQRLYINLYSYSAQCLWLSMMQLEGELEHSLSVYESIRDELLLEQALDFYYPDSIYLLAHKLSALSYPSWTMGLLNVWSTQTATPQRYQPYTPVTGPTSFVDLWIYELATLSVSESSIPLRLQELFELSNVKAAALANSMLLELRRLMPFGLKWFSTEAVDKIHSVIGSLLFAESDLYFSWALDLDVLESSLSPYTARSDHARSWFSIIHGEDINCSDGFTRRLLRQTKSYINNLDEFKQYLLEALGIEVEASFKTLPAFSVLRNLNATRDDISNYGPPQSVIDLNASDYKLTEVQYFSIFFKKINGAWVPRTVPGFPVKPDDAPLDVPVVTQESYALINYEGVLVEDLPMLIYPINDFLMRLDVDLGSVPIPADLSFYEEQVLPAGLSVNHHSTFISVGE